MGKIYYAVIIESSAVRSGSSNLIMAVNLAPNSQPKTVKPVSAPVRACMPLLRGGQPPYTTKGMKRGVGAFVRVCTVERLSSRNLRWQSRHGRGEAGTVHPASTRCFCPLFSGFSEAVVFGKTPKAKGHPEARFKDEGQKQDKSRASQVTPGWSQRPAVRAAFGLLRAGAGILGTVWRIWRVSAFGVISEGEITLWCQFSPEPYDSNGLSRGLSRLQGALGHRNQR